MPQSLLNVSGHVESPSSSACSDMLPASPLIKYWDVAVARAGTANHNQLYEEAQLSGKCSPACRLHIGWHACHANLFQISKTELNQSKMQVHRPVPRVDYSRTSSETHSQPK
eukprot:516805-Pelagomonas_calceolata.AAC.4